MGQLDEAIRAHLELKRKHGASEEEVHAEEQEALGPVRRETGEPTPPEMQAPAEPGGEHEFDPAPALEEPVPHEPPTVVPPGDAPAEYPPEAFHQPDEPLMEPALDPPLDTAEPPEATELTHEAESDEDAKPFAPEPAQPPGGDTPPRGSEQVEEAAPDEDGVAPPEENEDVLEETPDFLQETPEHDRLWFEQKPPRDFDFDE